MAGYRATPMQFQFLAVSGRAAGDASIRDQPPVKSRASPLDSPRNETRSLVLSASPSFSLSLSRHFSLAAVCPASFLFPTLCLPLALIPVNRLQPPARHPRFPSNIESPFALLLFPFAAVSTVLMRQMRSPLATSV